MDSIYAYTVPTFTKLLGGLRAVLDKGETFAREKNIDPSALLNERLAPDMFPLIRQVQIACDNAKGAVARLTGIENPKHEDTETTFDELRARIDTTLAFIASVKEDAFKDAADRKITLPYFPDSYMTGFDYAREYVVPNFVFHVVTAYSILRHNGVPLGKVDFLNGLPLKKL
jgi:hypothetical protein